MLQVDTQPAPLHIQIFLLNVRVIVSNVTFSFTCRLCDLSIESRIKVEILIQ